MPSPVKDTSDSPAASRLLKGTHVVKPPNFDGEGLVGILSHPMSVLLVFLPFGIAAHVLEWGKVWAFWLNFFAMIPLAKILGDATEELAAGLKNDMLAGLLNATFGNAVEVVITIQTLRRGLFQVVKATLLGSVLSNMLLVLGCSFFFGGIVQRSKPVEPPKLPTKNGAAEEELDPDSAVDRSSFRGFESNKVQTFSVFGALVNTSMLLLSCLSFNLVTVFSSVAHDDGIRFTDDTLLPVSRICSLIVGSAYVAYLVFQLGTHKDAMAEGEDHDDDDGAAISVKVALGLLVVTTMIVALCSEIIVEAIEGVTRETTMGKQFIGIILLPFVGNACEHAAAVRFAIQDKPGLSLAIAIGSSTQIALFVVPLSVLIGWAIDQPMDLNFGAFNAVVMTLGVIVVLSMIVDGHSNWLQGYLLCAAYAVIAVLYWYLPSDHMELE